MAEEYEQGEYYMHPKRQPGVAYIFNNTEFDRLPERKFSHKDSNDLFACLKAKYKFTVKEFQNLTVKEMEGKIEDVSKMDHKENTCFVCAFLTYGDDGLIYGKDKEITLQRLIAPLKGDQCLTLAGKPKIFILQTCSPDMPQADADVEETHTIPAEADFIYLWSTVPGSLTPTDGSGSVFIQALTQELKENTDLDLISVMTRAVQQVEKELDKSNKGKKWLKEKEILPYCINQLTKSLRLKGT